MGKPHAHYELGVIYNKLVEGQFPLFCYEFGFDGYHRGAKVISNQAEFEEIKKTIIARALEERREVRITNKDDRMVYWVMLGEVAWDGQGEPPPAEKTIGIENCTCDDVPSFLK